MRVIVVAMLTACGFQHGHARSDAAAARDDAPVDQPMPPQDAARVTIVIQAEAPSTSTADGHTWTAQALEPGFTGSGYITALPDDHANCVDALNPSCGPYNTYIVTVTVPGTYRVIVRHASAGSAEDSVFWYLGATPYTEDLDPDINPSWTDDSTTPQMVTLGPGTATFGLRMRETGVRIDSVRLELQ